MVDVKKVLGDVPEPKLAFWLSNGTVAKNIYELVSAIESCDQGVFQYHVNKEKNDFYNWVLNVLGDSALASKLKKEYDQKRFTQLIRKRIKELEKK